MSYPVNLLSDTTKRNVVLPLSPSTTDGEEIEIVAWPSLSETPCISLVTRTVSEFAVAILLVAVPGSFVLM